MKHNGLLSKEEIALADGLCREALDLGADGCRISLSKSRMNLCSVLNGKVDRISHCMDRAMSITLLVDGRHGSFSTNRLYENELREFVRQAIGITSVLAQDPCYSLPARERMADDASGNELELLDLPSIGAVSDKSRKDKALALSSYKKLKSKNCKIISEELELSDTIADLYLCDSAGNACRQSETSFDCGVEITIQTPNGNKVSETAWDSGSRPGRFEDLGKTAFRKARAKAGARPLRSGRYPMLVSNECSSRLLVPILNALGGHAIQQKNSFLEGKLGQEVFCSGLEITDRPRVKRANGARMFDAEGVKTKELTLVRDGKVANYLINTYIAAKTGMQPTQSDASRACVTPFKTMGTEDFKTFIEVTGFNGGNCNSATGDFSFGIEGFKVSRSGTRTRKTAVKEMLITGNMTELWSRLVAAGDDALPKNSHQVGSLLFSEVDFNGI